MARIEQTLGFKQTVKYFGGDRRKARKALRKAHKASGNDIHVSFLNRGYDIGYLFLWERTPQGHAFWMNICDNY